MFDQTYQNMVQLPQCSCTYIKHGIVSLIVGDIMCTRSPQHLYPSIKKLAAHSTEYLLLHGIVLLVHSRCWHVTNPCLRSL
jgi:hypothetical protein